MGLVFRCDDVSVNTNLPSLLAKLEYLRSQFRDATVILAISPLVVDMRATAEPERLFPREWTPRSDRRDFYHVQRAGLPDLSGLGPHTRAAHGLVHVDHRLLDHSAKELSVLVSCALVDARIFVPPFNYWDADLATICADHHIELIRFEDGWRHVKHTPRSQGTQFYFHPHDTTLADLQAWAE